MLTEEEEERQVWQYVPWCNSLRHFGSGEAAALTWSGLWMLPLSDFLEKTWNVGKCLSVDNRSFMSRTNWLSCFPTLFKMTSLIIYKSVRKRLSQSLQMVMISSSQPATPVAFQFAARNWLEIDFQIFLLGIIIFCLCCQFLPTPDFF